MRDADVLLWFASLAVVLLCMLAVWVCMVYRISLSCMLVYVLLVVAFTM